MKISSAIFSSAWALALVGMIWACSGSDFAGTSGKTSAVKKEDVKKPDASTGPHNKLGVPVNETKDIPKDAGGGCKSADETIAVVVGDKVEGKKKGETVLDCKGRKVKVDVYDPKEGIPPGIDDAGDDANDDGGATENSTGATSGKATENSTGGSGTVGATSSGGTGKATATSGGQSTTGGTDVADTGNATGKTTTTTGGDTLGVDDGGTSKNLTSDLIITTGLEDECGDDKVSVKVEAYVDQKVVVTQTYKCPKAGEATVIKDACRRNAATCIKITTINGKFTQDTWGNQLGCVELEQNDPTTATAYIDTNGAGFLGGCLGRNDDSLVVKCAESKSLSISNCLQ